MLGRNRNRKGFSLLELIIVMVIMGVLVTTVANATKGSSETSQISSTMASVNALQTASMQWYADNGNAFTGVSVASLVSSKFLGDAFTGTNANPWGGSFTLAVNGADSTKVDLTISSVPSTAATKLTTALAKKGLSGTYTATSKAYVITM